MPRGLTRLPSKSACTLCTQFPRGVGPPADQQKKFFFARGPGGAFLEIVYTVYTARRTDCLPPPGALELAQSREEQFGFAPGRMGAAEQGEMGRDARLRQIEARVIKPISHGEEESTRIEIAPDKDEQVLPGGKTTTTIRLADADIAGRRPGTLSLMPNGLLKDLKPEDLADLYASLVAEGQMTGYAVDRRFYEIGSPDGLRETCAYLAGQFPSV